MVPIEPKGMFGAQPARSKPNWAHILADTLAGAAGQPGPFAQMASQRRAAEQQGLAEAAKREADFAYWQRQQDYTRANPAPVQNDTVNDYEFIRQKLGDDAANQYLRHIGDPVVNVPMPNGSMYVGSRSGLAAALSGGARPAAPTGPVGTLRPYQGGPASAPGGFPR